MKRKVNLKIKKVKIKKDDTIISLLGRDRGKTGKVLRVDHKSGRVLVEGLNTVKRHVKSMQGVEGGIIDLAKSMQVSNLMLVCPKCKKPTRVSFKLNGEIKQRLCKKCGEAI